MYITIYSNIYFTCEINYSRSNSVRIIHTFMLYVQPDYLRTFSPLPWAVWRQFESDLRRGPALREDISVLTGMGALPPAPSAAALRYTQRLAEAAAVDSSGGPPLLLGHFYCRYLADLFGGSMLVRSRPGSPLQRVCRASRSSVLPSPLRRVLLTLLWLRRRRAGQLDWHWASRTSPHSMCIPKPLHCTGERTLSACTRP